MNMLFIFSGLSEHIIMFNLFISNKVNTSCEAAFYSQFTMRVNFYPRRHHLSLFLYINALICPFNKLIYFHVD